MASVFLGFRFVVLDDGPRLDLPTAEYGEDDSTDDVDPGSHPEHLSPACHGALRTGGEEVAACYCAVIYRASR